MRNGFIKSPRAVLSSDIWDMPLIYHRVWFYLQHRAEWRPVEFPTERGFSIWLQPGQIITSLGEICDEVAWRENRRRKVPAKKTASDVLKWLAFRGWITLISNEHGTFINIPSLNPAEWSAGAEAVTGNGTGDAAEPYAVTPPAVTGNGTGDAQVTPKRKTREEVTAEIAADAPPAPPWPVLGNRELRHRELENPTLLFNKGGGSDWYYCKAFLDWWDVYKVVSNEGQIQAAQQWNYRIKTWSQVEELMLATGNYKTLIEGEDWDRRPLLPKNFINTYGDWVTPPEPVKVERYYEPGRGMDPAPGMLYRLNGEALPITQVNGGSITLSNGVTLG